MTTTNPQSPLSELEGLEILYGPKPLLSFQPRFPTRQALLNYYAANVQSHFAVPSSSASKCEMCNLQGPPATLVFNNWSGTLRLHWPAILLLTLLSPILLALALIHMIAILKPILEKFQLRDEVCFRTIHCVCKKCRSNLKLRRSISAVLKFVVLFICGVAGVSAIVTGSLLVSMLLNRFGFRAHDATFAAIPFGISVVLCAGAVMLNQFVIARIRLPKQLRSIVKKPFRLTDSQFLLPGQSSPR